MTTTSIRPTTLGLRRGALAAGGAVLAAALLWAVAHILGVELRVDTRTGLPALAVTLPSSPEARWPPRCSPSRRDDSWTD